MVLDFNPIIVLFSSASSSNPSKSIWISILLQSYFHQLQVIQIKDLNQISILLQSYFHPIEFEEDVEDINFNPIIVLFSSRNKDKKSELNYAISILLQSYFHQAEYNKEKLDILLFQSYYSLIFISEMCRGIFFHILISILLQSYFHLYQILLFQSGRGISILLQSYFHL